MQFLDWYYVFIWFNLKGNLEKIKKINNFFISKCIFNHQFIEIEYKNILFSHKF